MGLNKGGIALGHDAEEQDGQRAERDGDGGYAISLETGFGRMPPFQALGCILIGAPRSGFGKDAHFIRTGRKSAHSYCSLYLRTTCRARIFIASVAQNSTSPSAKAARVLALSNS